MQKRHGGDGAKTRQRRGRDEAEMWQADKAEVRQRQSRNKAETKQR